MDSDIYDSTNEMVFGGLVQNRLIMEKNFEGKQFIIDGKGKQPNLDSMFFSCEKEDIVGLDPTSLHLEKDLAGKNKKKYLFGKGHKKFIVNLIFTNHRFFPKNSF